MHNLFWGTLLPPTIIQHFTTEFDAAEGCKTKNQVQQQQKQHQEQQPQQQHINEQTHDFYWIYCCTRACECIMSNVGVCMNKA